MDRKLRKLMRHREEARRQVAHTQKAIVEYVKKTLADRSSDDAQYEFLTSEMRHAYITGHLAGTLSAFDRVDANHVESIDEVVEQVMIKKAYQSRGNSIDRRSKEEERAYGNAKEAWSYTLKEAGLR